MSDPDERPPAPPRFPPAGGFPYAAAVFCAACVGAAGWTWMRCSYAWEVTPAQLNLSFALDEASPLSAPGDHYYARVTGKVDHIARAGDDGATVVLEDDVVPSALVYVWLAEGQVPAAGRAADVKGRVRGPFAPDLIGPADKDFPFVVDARRSRLTGASVAGLVVGAMGVFVFALAFRHWMRERGRIKTLPEA